MNARHGCSAVVIVFLFAVAMYVLVAPAYSDEECLAVTVGWAEDGVVTSVAIDAVVEEGLEPRVSVVVLDEQGFSLWSSMVLGETSLYLEPGVGPASEVVVTQGWSPGPLCRVSAGAPARPIPTPTAEPTAEPTVGPARRTLHSR